MTKPKRRNIFFTADLHINHTNCIKYCDRPFKTIEEMNDKIIKTWNKQVKEHDIVYVLGDFVWNTTPKRQIREMMNNLNGVKYMVIGNHDKLTVQQCLNLGFDFACYEMKIRIGGNYTRLSHYPYRYSTWKEIKSFLRNPFTWHKRTNVRHKSRRPRDDGGWLIHGHTHKKYKIRGKQVHVGWDAWGRLVNFGEIESMMSKYEEKK